jgi:hypothetical protein
MISVEESRQSNQPQPADYEDALTAIAAFVHSHPSFIMQIFEHPVTIRNVSVGADYTEVLEAIRRAGYIIPAGEAMMIGIGDVDEFNATSSGGLKISRLVVTCLTHAEINSPSCRNMPILTWWSKYCTFVRIGIQWPRFSSQKIYKDERSPRVCAHLRLLMLPKGHKPRLKLWLLSTQIVLPAVRPHESPRRSGLSALWAHGL